MGDFITEGKNIDEVIASILFIAGDSIEISFIAQHLDITVDQVNKAIERLKEKYSSACGIHIQSFKGKVQFTSNPSYADYIAQVLNPIKEKQLTKTALETIAIICYKQPVTRLEIENIRGASCDYAIALLQKHNLIEVVGRKDAVGKPLLYGTTDEFLKRFELENLDELPNYEEVLERIQVIRQESYNLYNTFKIPDDDTENASDIPEFLQGEDIELIEEDR